MTPQARHHRLVKAVFRELWSASADARAGGEWTVALPATEGLIKVTAAAHPKALEDVRGWMRRHRGDGRWTALVHQGWKLPGQLRRTPQLNMPFEDFARLYGRLEFLERDRRRLLDEPHVDD